MPPAETTPLEIGRPNLGATVRKYLNIFRASLVERMAYRGDFLLGTVLRFLPVLTTVLLWEAVFAGSGKTEFEGSGKEAISFTRKEMIAYLLLIHISRMFSSMPGLAAGITRDIRDGSLKKYLVQPLDMIGYLLAYRAAHKTAYITTSAIPYALLFLACGSYFKGLELPDLLTFAGYLVSLLLAFLIGFYFEACLGMTGFWLLEVTSLLWVVGTLNYFISGQMLPLDLLPGFWANLLKALPFQYLAYFPAVVLLGKVTGWKLVEGLAWQFAWVVVFALLTRWLYYRGLRRYSAFGG
jgi:ABC-2 type transport system permease protein